MSTAGQGVIAFSVFLMIVSIGAPAAALVLSSDRNDESDQLAVAAEEEREREEAADAAEAEREEMRLERTVRQTLVADLEKSITKDAQSESEESFALIDGPILETQCDPEGGVVDIEATTQSFDCLAVNKYTGGGGASGYRYAAEVNYKNFSYRWRLGGGGL